MNIINRYTSGIQEVRDSLSGSWGTEIYEHTKISYLGRIIIAEGDLTIIKSKLKKQVYDLHKIGDNIYLGWIKE